MWINAVVKFFSRPALQSESSPPWIFSTFAKRFTSISCRKQTRYFSAYSGDPLLANMFGPYSYLTTCFLKAVALQGTHPSRPKNSTIGGLVAMSKLHPGGEEPNNLEWNVCVCARVTEDFWDSQIKLCCSLRPSGLTMQTVFTAWMARSEINVPNLRD